ncbi:MAG: cation transporter [Ignavibacteria bacterium]|nr:cation transporter [Ignavibacteria bacterium]
MPKLKRAADISLGINLFLFLIKISVGIITNSIAVLSEAFNSLTDIISSIALKKGVVISRQEPDDDHPYGHTAAQPLAAFIIAVFALVVAIEIIQESIGRVISPEEVKNPNLIYIVLSITIITKIILSSYQKKIGKSFNSTAMKAAAIDSLNDILASSIAMIGVFCAVQGYLYFDGIAGILVGAFIFKTGYEVGKENIDYLMAKSADSNLLSEIRKISLQTEGVLGMNDLRSHYIGDQFHIEIHIQVDKNLSIQESHDIGDNLRTEILRLKEIQDVFVHIDPV